MDILEMTVERIINHIPMMNDKEYINFFKQEMKCVNECLNLLDKDIV